jgi:hypothetical protein
MLLSDLITENSKLVYKSLAFHCTSNALALYGSIWEGKVPDFRLYYPWFCGFPQSLEVNVGIVTCTVKRSYPRKGSLNDCIVETSRLSNCSYCYMSAVSNNADLVPFYPCVA